VSHTHPTDAIPPIPIRSQLETGFVNNEVIEEIFPR